MTRKKKSKDPKPVSSSGVESTNDNASEAAAQLDELSKRVDEAAALIAELREKNHVLRAEAAELRREVEAKADNESRDAGSADGEPDRALVAEVEELRREREAIRSKVQSLLVRIEKLEPYADGD